MKPLRARIGRYQFQYGTYPPGAPARRWSCGVTDGPAGMLGAGGERSPLAALLECRRFERECAARRLEASE